MTVQVRGGVVIVRAVVFCDGTGPDRQCRAYLPTAAASVDKARMQAAAEGWSHPAGGDHCPACTRRRIRMEAEA